MTQWNVFFPPFRKEHSLCVCLFFLAINVVRLSAEAMTVTRTCKTIVLVPVKQLTFVPICLPVNIIHHGYEQEMLLRYVWDPEKKIIPFCYDDDAQRII